MRATTSQGRVGDIRFVPLTVDQAQTIAEIGKDLLRQGDARAAMLLALYLQWRLLGQASSNVVSLDAYSRRAPCS